MSDLERQAKTLKLHGLLAHWQEVAAEPWLARFLDWEDQERARRGLERRLRRARLCTFKPIADFDWSWPKKIDRQHLANLFGPIRGHQPAGLRFDTWLALAEILGLDTRTLLDRVLAREGLPLDRERRRRATAELTATTVESGLHELAKDATSLSGEDARALVEASVQVVRAVSMALAREPEPPAAG